MTFRWRDPGLMAGSWLSRRRPALALFARSMPNLVVVRPAVLWTEEAGPRIPSWTVPWGASIGKGAGRVTLKQSWMKISIFSLGVCVYLESGGS